MAFFFLFDPYIPWLLEMEANVPKKKKKRGKKNTKSR